MIKIKKLFVFTLIAVFAFTTSGLAFSIPDELGRPDYANKSDNTDIELTIENKENDDNDEKEDNAKEDLERKYEILLTEITGKIAKIDMEYEDNSFTDKLTDELDEIIESDDDIEAKIETLELLQEKLQNHIDTEKLSSKVSYYIEDNVITLDWGTKSTGGYIIEITEIKMDSEDNLVVIYKTTSPAPDEPVTMAITNPTDSKEIPEEYQDFEDVVLKDATEEKIKDDEKEDDEKESQGKGIGREMSEINRRHRDKRLEVIHGDELIENRKELLAEIKNMKKQEQAELLNREVKDRLFVQGRTLEYDVPPVIIEGRTLVPVRVITEELGAEVDWEADTETIIIERDETIITFALDDTTVYVNGEEQEIDVPSQLINDRTMVPLRFISEVFDESVSYIPETGDIDIGLETEEDTKEEEIEDTEEDKEDKVKDEEEIIEDSDTEDKDTKTEDK